VQNRSERYRSTQPFGGRAVAVVVVVVVVVVDAVIIIE
jgi:hypothetical protein